MDDLFKGLTLEIEKIGNGIQTAFGGDGVCRPPSPGTPSQTGLLLQKPNYGTAPLSVSSGMHTSSSPGRRRHRAVMEPRQLAPHPSDEELGGWGQGVGNRVWMAESASSPAGSLVPNPSAFPSVGVVSREDSSAGANGSAAALDSAVDTARAEGQLWSVAMRSTMLPEMLGQGKVLSTTNELVVVIKGKVREGDKENNEVSSMPKASEVPEGCVSNRLAYLFGHQYAARITSVGKSRVVQIPPRKGEELLGPGGESLVMSALVASMAESLGDALRGAAALKRGGGGDKFGKYAEKYNLPVTERIRLSVECKCHGYTGKAIVMKRYVVFHPTGFLAGGGTVYPLDRLEQVKLKDDKVVMTLGVARSVDSVEPSPVSGSSGSPRVLGSPELSPLRGPTRTASTSSINKVQLGNHARSRSPETKTLGSGIKFPGGGRSTDRSNHRSVKWESEDVEFQGIEDERALKQAILRHQDIVHLMIQAEGPGKGHCVRILETAGQQFKVQGGAAVSGLQGMVGAVQAGIVIGMIGGVAVERFHEGDLINTELVVGNTGSTTHIESLVACSCGASIFALKAQEFVKRMGEEPSVSTKAGADGKSLVLRAIAAQLARRLVLCASESYATDS